jgi:hypothetical protein
MITQTQEFKAIDKRFEQVTQAHFYVGVPYAEWQALKAKLTSPGDAKQPLRLNKTAYDEFRELWSYGKRYRGMKYGSAFCAHFDPPPGIQWLVMNLSMAQFVSMINDIYVIE